MKCEMIKCGEVSDFYAKWFITNNVIDIYREYTGYENQMELYEEAVKHLCQQEGIEFEGV